MTTVVKSVSGANQHLGVDALIHIVNMGVTGVIALTNVGKIKLAHTVF